MGLLAAWDRFIARSAYEGGKRQAAETHRLRERDAGIRQARIEAGVEEAVDWGIRTPQSTDRYSLVTPLAVNPFHLNGGIVD